MSAVHYSQIIIMAQLRLSLFKQLIKRRDSNKIIKLKMVTNLADMTVRKWWLLFETDSLILQKLRNKQEYCPVNKKFYLIIQTRLEEISRKISALGNSAQEKHLHTLIYTETLREQARRRRHLRQRQRGSGVKKTRIEESTLIPQGPQATTKEVTQKVEQEKLIKDIGNMIRIKENTPPIKASRSTRTQSGARDCKIK